MAQPTADVMDVAYYERLVYATAHRIQGLVEEDLEDIQQILRTKVVMALRAYDHDRCKTSVDRFVFSCVMNMKKDLLKRVKRDWLFIEDVAPPHNEAWRERWELRHLSSDNDYVEIERELPAIPPTITRAERDIIVRLYAGRSEHKTRVELGLSRDEMDAAMESIKAKMTARPFVEAA